ncbi:MAG: electron transfer flavoprotein subunit alpha/FixB family protein [Longimicrobiales bacterium]
MANILAVTEQRDGSLRRISEEVVSAARTLAEQTGGVVHAIVIGPAGMSSAVTQLAKFGAEVIHVVENDALKGYSPDGYVHAIADHIRSSDYFAVLFGATTNGKDLAPRIAARLDVPLAGDATGLAMENGEIVITRPMYAGRAFARITLDGSPRMVSIRPNVFRPEERAAAGAVQPIAMTGDASAWKVKVREVKAAVGGNLDVSEAPIVISGGRGLKGPEQWPMLEQLRDAFGSRAALGASRAVVDAGWRPHGEQVGQTGKTVSPQLYIAVGISGAMQHLAGMRSAKTIVAINKDPDAPIFKIADYGIVGDFAEILPALTEAIKAEQKH